MVFSLHGLVCWRLTAFKQQQVHELFFFGGGDKSPKKEGLDSLQIYEGTWQKNGSCFIFNIVNN